jgi:hypothetical protein
MANKESWDVPNQPPDEHGDRSVASIHRAFFSVTKRERTSRVFKQCPLTVLCGCLRLPACRRSGARVLLLRFESGEREPARQAGGP